MPYAPAAVVTVMCLIVIILFLYLPETMGYELPKTIEELKQWYKDNRGIKVWIRYLRSRRSQNIQWFVCAIKWWTNNDLYYYHIYFKQNRFPCFWYDRNEKGKDLCDFVFFTRVCPLCVWHSLPKINLGRMTSHSILYRMTRFPSIPNTSETQKLDLHRWHMGSFVNIFSHCTL